MKSLCWQLVTLMLFAMPLAYGEIFKWVDERGNIHYGDAPPESAKTETVTPNTDKLGVQLSHPDSSQQWKQDALQTPPGSSAPPPAASNPNNTRRQNNADFQYQDWCDTQTGTCFSEQQDYVCKLRYGVDCERVYHWKVCQHQTCEINRLSEKCESPFYYLNKRPEMLGRRDLGRPLAFEQWVSAADWQCLSRHGFFCDEVAFEQQCQEQYAMSCTDLKNWLATAKQRCDQDRRPNCDLIDTLVLYRPMSVEETKRRGTRNAKGVVLTHDLLMRSLQAEKDNPDDYGKLQPVLESMTGLNISNRRRSFDCERYLPSGDDPHLPSRGIY